MVRCPKCKSDDYEINYIEDYSYEGDKIIVLAKTHCCECEKEFWVKEFFTFDSAKNVF